MFVYTDGRLLILCIDSVVLASANTCNESEKAQ